MAGKFESQEERFFLFFSCKEQYALKTGKRENYVVILLMFFNVHRITLQLLVNQECWATNLGS